jgi:hypothetical protein
MKETATNWKVELKEKLKTIAAVKLSQRVKGQ